MLDGKFILGVGSGEALNEHILGTPWPSADVRLEMLEEAVGLIRRLWEGDITGYPSESEADAALCELLAFWGARDPAQLDRLVRRSGLYRPKWDERRGADGATYGQVTIARALA